MINELIEDKTKLEKSILELLNEFKEKYPNIIFEDISIVHTLERNLGGDIVINKITSVKLDLKI